MDLYDLVYADAPADVSAALTEVTGTIPTDLAGTVVRNGPGLFRVGADALNFFDAHGYVAGVSFRDGKASLRGRLVETAILKEHRAASRQTRRGVFTNHPSRWKNLFAVDMSKKNPCMHDAYFWGGRLFASDQPFHAELDPRTLTTIGAHRWAGVCPPGTEMCPMPRIDPATNRLVVFVNQQKPGARDRLSFVELDPDHRVAARSEPVTLAYGPAIVHGHAFSERWYIAPEQPAKLDVLAALWGKKTVWDSFVWPKELSPTLVLVERTARNPRTLRVPLSPGHRVLFHLYNAFGDEQVVVDLTSYPEETSFGSLAPRELLTKIGTPIVVNEPGPRTYRMTVDTRTGKVIEEKLLGPGSEAVNIDPRFRGRKTRYLFGPTLAAAGDERTPSFYGSFHALCRLDAETGAVDTWSAGPRCLVSPPAFAPRAGSSAEGDGYLLAWVIDGERRGTDLVLLDAMKVGAGPVARLSLGVTLPSLSHNNFFTDLQLQ